MQIYIPNIKFSNVDKRSLFILTRPFYSENSWSNNTKHIWNISNDINYINTIKNANIYLIPENVTNYSKSELFEINNICAKHQIFAFGFIGGDFVKKLGTYSNIIFYCAGGFKRQLSQNYKGFPVSLSDHFQRIYQKDEIDVRPKHELPVVGFCGHADLSSLKRIKENIKYLKENIKRLFNNPLRKDYEPFFPSAYNRAKLLHSLEQSKKINSNFIYRKKYRGGAVTPNQREQTTIEYYDNIYNSDYVLCVRGAGNFSVRFYETLMLGRIPIFVNTDCLLPFEDKINWKNHVVWIEWKERKNIANIVADFHANLSNEEFMNIQTQNRKLWKETLSVKGMLSIINNDI